MSGRSVNLTTLNGVTSHEEDTGISPEQNFLFRKSVFALSLILAIVILLIIEEIDVLFHQFQR